MKVVATFFKKHANRLLSVPKAIAGGFISLALIVGGLIQFGEYLPKYFPDLYAWLERNIVPIAAIIGLLLIGLVSALVWFNGRLREELREREQKEEERRLSDLTCKLVLFISPDPAGDFYLQYFSHLVRKAVQKADSTQNILITLLCPSERFERGFVPETSMEMASKYPVHGVFMIPSDPDEPSKYQAILEFQQQYPTVLLDVYPGESEIPDGPHFVGGNEQKGGETAATLAFNYLNRIGKSNGRVLIMLGRATKWEMQRANGFKAKLQELLPQIQFAPPTDYLHYQKEDARREIEQRLQVDAAGVLALDLIFSCNDEMAIGAFEALDAYCRATWTQPDKVPKVIGYDGTDEMKSLIERANPFVLGTVDVRIAEQADQAVAMMRSLLKGETITRRHFAIGPKLISNKAFFNYKP